MTFSCPARSWVLKFKIFFFKCLMFENCEKNLRQMLAKNYAQANRCRHGSCSAIIITLFNNVWRCPNNIWKESSQEALEGAYSIIAQCFTKVWKLTTKLQPNLILKHILCDDNRAYMHHSTHLHPGQFFLLAEHLNDLILWPWITRETEVVGVSPPSRMTVTMCWLPLWKG